MKKLLILLCVCSLLVGGTVVTVAQKNSRQKLRTDLSKVRNAKVEASRKLADARRKVRAASLDLSQLDNQLEKVENQLNQLSSRLSTARAERTRLATELKATEEKLREKQLEVSRREKQIYMRGEKTPVTQLLSSRTLGELAENRYLLAREAKLNKSLFAEFEQLKQQIEQQKKRQDELVAEVASLVVGQREKQDELQAYRNAKSKIFRDLKNQQDKLERLINHLDSEERELEDRINGYVSTSNLPAFKGRFMKPVNARAGSGFGMRFHPILKRYRPHNGVDFGARHGAPIFAAADGVVAFAAYGRGFGNYVVIDHGGGVTTTYAHCSRLNVRKGQRVKRGQTIAKVGSTGLSTGPHLHFEVRINGKPVNPMGRF